MLTPDTSARRAFAGPLCNTRFILALGLALMFGSHLTAFSALAQTDVNLIVIKNASGQGVARFTDDGYWFLQGAVHENSGAITLNANKKYWAIRNTTQAVVFAIDCTTGDLFTSGTIEVGQQEFDTTNSLYTLTSPTAGKLLMTVNASGTAALAGAPLPEVPSSPPSIPPLPADPGDPPAPNFQKYYKLLTDGVGSVLCPEPQGQTRIYFAWPQGTFSDVSYKNWRRPYIPGGTPSDYGLRLGCRYWMEPNGARTGNWTFWYGIANSASLSDEACTIQEIDASVSKNESGGYYNYGSYNMDAYHTPGDTWPSTFVVGANPLARSLTDSGNQYNLCQYHVGQFWPYCEPSLKDQTDDTSMSAASSNLWLYRMEWEHPAWIPRRKAVDYNGLTILKEDGQPDSTYLDTPVRVGCWLEGLPNATDIKKITLTLYDPAHPRMMRCLETEQTSVSELFTMWD
ncbi:MAG TPA: hypothetical protein PKH31_17390, partial [Candidatus Sumerlaeota bacterium]|nr:hypothetical protein [Candidatus Sumerlaeota bacterium]